MSRRILDFEVAIDNAAGNKKLAVDMLYMLSKSFVDDLVIIDELIDKRDIIEIANLIHRMYGGVCYSGLPKLKKQLQSLDLSLNGNTHNCEIDEVINKLEQIKISIKEILALDLNSIGCQNNKS